MTTTPTSGAADLLDLIEAYAEARHRQGHSSYNAQTAAALQAVKDALAAGQATAAQQGVAYAALPTSSYAGRVYEEGFLIGTCPLYTADQLHAFADATHTLRASHGQAPAWATKPTEQQILEAAFAPAQPAAEASRFGSPELQAMIIARCVEKDQADSVLEDAARLDFLVAHRAYVVSDEDCCDGYWLHYVKPDGATWVQISDHATPRAAIDAAMNKGGA